jgi:hypothetical protein
MIKSWLFSITATDRFNLATKELVGAWIARWIHMLSLVTDAFSHQTDKINGTRTSYLLVRFHDLFSFRMHGD